VEIDKLFGTELLQNGVWWKSLPGTPLDYIAQTGRNFSDKDFNSLWCH
jgi:hypothetical protein